MIALALIALLLFVGMVLMTAAVWAYWLVLELIRKPKSHGFEVIPRDEPG